MAKKQSMTGIICTMMLLRPVWMGFEVFMMDKG